MRVRPGRLGYLEQPVLFPPVHPNYQFLQQSVQLLQQLFGIFSDSVWQGRLLMHQDYDPSVIDLSSL